MEPQLLRGLETGRRKFKMSKQDRKAEKARRLNQPPMSSEDAKKQIERVKAGSKMGPSYGVNKQ